MSMHCPKCGNEVKCLHQIQKVWEIYEFRLRDDEPHYEHFDTGPCYDSTIIYECPECQAELANHEEDAINFLKGEITEEMAEYYMKLAMEGGEK